MSLPREFVTVRGFLVGGDVLPNLSGSLSRDLTDSGGLKWKHTCNAISNETITFPKVNKQGSLVMSQTAYMYTTQV